MGFKLRYSCSVYGERVLILRFLSLSLWIFLPLSFYSCATYGPKRENDSLIDHLDGHKYQLKDNTLNTGKPSLLFPVKREPPVFTIRGTVLFSLDALVEPVKHQVVILKRMDREILRTQTDRRGQFLFAGDISNGHYTIELLSPSLSGKQDLVVSAYDTANIQILASRKPAQE